MTSLPVANTLLLHLGPIKHKLEQKKLGRKTKQSNGLFRREEDEDIQREENGATAPLLS